MQVGSLAPAPVSIANEDAAKKARSETEGGEWPQNEKEVL
jgi:hypothetical protein